MEPGAGERASVELHDSTVGSVKREGTRLLVSLRPAYVHRSPGAPGVDPGTGWTQDAILEFPDAELDGLMPTLPCVLSDGALHVADRVYDNLIPAPMLDEGDVRATLTFEDGSEVHVRARGLRLELRGEASYVEDVE